LDTTATTHAALVSARLLRTEVIRVLRREAIPLHEGAKVLSRVRLVNVTNHTFTVAESIERHVKTLDALHLAAALALAPGVVVASHDAVMLQAALALGLAAFDPVGINDGPIVLPCTV
jgi:hypothetical protein